MAQCPEMLDAFLNFQTGPIKNSISNSGIAQLKIRRYKHQQAREMSAVSHSFNNHDAFDSCVLQTSILEVIRKVFLCAGRVDRNGRVCATVKVSVIFCCFAEAAVAGKLLETRALDGPGAGIDRTVF